MIAYIIRRILYAIPILIGVNLITFILFFTVNTPDDMARMHLGMKRVTDEAIIKWKEERDYDKPLIYYPLSTLMLAGIRDILLITTPQDQDQFIRTLGDGSQWGISITYVAQSRPEGLAQAYILAEAFLSGAPSAMVLGDNIFFGHGLPQVLANADAVETGGTVFGYRVADPERYGVVDFDANGTVKSIIEKPPAPPSNASPATGRYPSPSTAAVDRSARPRHTSARLVCPGSSDGRAVAS